MVRLSRHISVWWRTRRTSVRLSHLSPAAQPLLLCLLIKESKLWAAHTADVNFLMPQSLWITISYRYEAETLVCRLSYKSGFLFKYIEVQLFLRHVDMRKPHPQGLAGADSGGFLMWSDRVRQPDPRLAGSKGSRTGGQGSQQGVNRWWTLGCIYSNIVRLLIVYFTAIITWTYIL